MTPRILLVLILVLPGFAAAQAPAVAPPPGGEIDPAPRPGLAPVPDRRFPEAVPAVPEGVRIIPAVPTAPAPTRGSSFTDRDGGGERGGAGESIRPEPGVSLSVPIR